MKRYNPYRCADKICTNQEKEIEWLKTENKRLREENFSLRQWIEKDMKASEREFVL